MFASGAGTWKYYRHGILGSGYAVSLGLAQRQGDLLDDVVRYCDQVLRPDSVYSLLHHERDRLFPDEFFADLFSERGRRLGPPFGGGDGDGAPTHGGLSSACCRAPRSFRATVVPSSWPRSGGAHPSRSSTLCCCFRKMAAPHDCPDPLELLAALRELFGDVLDAVQGRVRFHVRVALNVIDAIDRELRLGEEQCSELHPVEPPSH